MSRHALKQLCVGERRKPASIFDGVRALVSVELVIRRSDARMPVLLAILAGLCLLVTPPENASYAVLTIGGLKPVMSAGTHLIAAAVVLNLLLFPALLLTLGVGCTRDRQLGMTHFLATSPIGPRWSMAARLLANAILLAGLCLLLLIALSTTIVLREGHMPALSAMGQFLLLTYPAALFSLPLAAALDRWLGQDSLLQAAVSFALYALCIALAFSGACDVFGLQLLKQGWPVGQESFAIGIVAAPTQPGVRWNIDLIRHALLYHQAAVILAAFCAAFFVASPVSWLARFQPDNREPSSKAGEHLLDLPPAFHPSLSRCKPRKTTYLREALILVRRWLRRSALTGAVGLAALILSAAYPRVLKGGALVALLIPLLVANRGGLAGGASRDVELSSPAMWRPTPTLFAATVLAGVVALLLAPVLLASSLLAGLHLLAGLYALSLWLTWTCTQLNRPLLGISTYALVWYLASFSSLPRVLDFVGLEGTTEPGLEVAALTCAVLATLCLRGDKVASRRSKWMGRLAPVHLRRSN